jgi:hypothetical protein
MVLGEAFEAAVKELPDDAQPEVARDLIAGPIIAAARLGEVAQVARDRVGPAPLWRALDHAHGQRSSSLPGHHDELGLGEA